MNFIEGAIRGPFPLLTRETLRSKAGRNDYESNLLSQFGFHNLAGCSHKSILLIHMELDWWSLIQANIMVLISAVLRWRNPWHKWKVLSTSGQIVSDLPSDRVYVEVHGISRVE